MAHEEEIKRIMEALVIADDKIVGEIMAAQGIWGEGQSARVQAARALKNLASTNQLEKGVRFYRLPGCKSEYGEHAKLISQAIARLKTNFPNSIIHREHTVIEVGLCPDIMAMVIGGQEANCAIIEIVNHETERYLESKLNVWDQWSGACQYLSRLFGYRIPHFEFIALREGESICDKLSLT